MSTLSQTADSPLPTRQFVPRFDYTPTQITELTEQFATELTVLADEIGQLPLEACTFDKVVRRWAEESAQRDLEMEVLTFLQHVSTDSEVREASRAAEKKWGELWIQLNQREDFYLRYKKVASEVEEGGYVKGEHFDSLVDQRLLEHSLRTYRRMGLELTPKQRAVLKELLNRLQELGTEFSKNIAEDQSCLLFRTEELTGVAQDYLDRTAKNAQEQADKDQTKYDGRHRVTAQYPDVFPILEFCQVRETRRQVMKMFESRAQENLPLLKELTQLRQRRADLLGYEHNVAYQTEVLMTKTAERVQNFMAEVLEKLSPGCSKYVQELTELLRTDLGEPEAQLEYWDYGYYHQKYLQQQHQLDHQLLKEYFPTDYVCAEMFKIYSQMFHLSIQKTEPPTQPWHETVTYYEVRDRTSDSDSVIGHFYMDLYPREGKFSHAAAWSMPGYQEKLDENKHLQVLPFGCLVCNFTAPTSERPSLLTYTQVTTFFHEFGHIIHGLCGGYRNRYADFSGTNTEKDFVEAPSQMIEQWLWEPLVLEKISRHFKSETSLPAELLKSLLASRYLGKTRDWTRQAVLAMIDYRLHTRGDWSSEEEMMTEYRTVSDQYMGYPCGTGQALASWGHLGGGYDAKYYSYLWSRVIACDLYSRFEENGDPLNVEIGLSYRREILEPGGTRDGLTMVQNYLGREMRIEPFLRSLGVGC